MIMGWGTDDILITTFDDKQMAILNASDKLYSLTTLTFIDGFCEILIQISDEYVSILGLEISSVMGDDLTVFESDDITANGKIIICHLVTYRSSL